MMTELKKCNLVEFPMPLVQDGDTIDYDNIPMGYTKKDIVWKKFGIQSYPCVMVKGTEKEKEECLRFFDTLFRKERREKRCLVYNKKGELIRCPAGNSCSECKKREGRYFSTLKPLSLEKLMLGDSEEDATIDIPDGKDAEAEAIGFAVLDELLEHLGSFNMGYEEIFQLLMDEESVADMAKRYDLPWSTMKDRVNKVKELAMLFVE